MPSPHRDTTQTTPETETSDPRIDHDRNDLRAMQVVATVFALGVPAGIVNIAFSAGVRQHVQVHAVILLDIALLTTARLISTGRWERWPPHAQLAVLAVGSLTTIMTGFVYGFDQTNALINGVSALVVLSALWLGATQNPATPTLALAVLVAPAIAFAGARTDFASIKPSIGLLLISAPIAELIAFSRAQERTSRQLFRLLFEATQRLDITIDNRHLAQHLAEVARRAFGAPQAIVLRGGLGRYEIAGTSPSAPDDDLATNDEPPLTTDEFSPSDHIMVDLVDNETFDAVAIRLKRRRDRRVILEATPLLAERLNRFIRDHNAITQRLNTDPLTGVGNYQAAQNAIDELRAGQTVVMFDIDHFKNINDLLGHAAGDAILQHVASCLRSQLRPNDVICRPGGDEFLVILRSETNPSTVIERVLEQWHGAEPLVTLSAGLAIARPTETGLQTLARADAALYQAKAHGRARLTAATTRPASG